MYTTFNMAGFFWVLLSLSILISCGDDPAKNDTNPPYDPPLTDTTEVVGFNILSRLPGIWNGPVTSSTPLGSYPEWIVDFRPISSAQISAKNELDSLNDIFMSFFVVKHGAAYKVAFRNGGGFAGLQRNSYMIIDSVSETGNQAFYRFVDFAAGQSRVFTDVQFKQDSLIVHTYTNQYNTLTTPVTHMMWRAQLKDTTSAISAIDSFDFPQKEIVKDFTNIFDGLTEAVFYQPEADPYPENEQPYLGQTTANVSIAAPPVVNANKKVLIIISTQPLFNGFVFVPSRLDFRSRYVFIDAAASTSFTFNYFHPGTYYVNAIYDNNGDLSFSSGDYINTPFDQSFTLTTEGTAAVDVTINFEIP